MTAETLTLTLPPPLARDLGEVTEDFVVELLERGLREMRIDRALERYTRGGMSLGAAAQMAGVTQSEMSRYAYARGLEPPFSPETLVEELA